MIEDSKEIVGEEIEKAIVEMKAGAVFKKNLDKSSSITDLVIICSATSRRHLTAIVEKVVNLAKTMHVDYRVSGSELSGWMVIDMGFIIVHVMLEDIRDLYKLEDVFSGRVHKQ